MAHKRNIVPMKYVRNADKGLIYLEGYEAGMKAIKHSVIKSLRKG